MANSRFKLEDEEIPFYQMVVRGYVDYTGALITCRVIRIQGNIF